MQLTDFARKVPEEVWRRFEPILPPGVWGGNGGNVSDLLIGVGEAVIMD